MRKPMRIIAYLIIAAAVVLVFATFIPINLNAETTDLPNNTSTICFPFPPDDLPFGGLCFNS